MYRFVALEAVEMAGYVSLPTMSSTALFTSATVSHIVCPPQVIGEKDSAGEDGSVALL